DAAVFVIRSPPQRLHPRGGRPVAKAVEERHSPMQQVVGLLRVEPRSPSAGELRFWWRRDGGSGLARSLRAGGRGLRLGLSHRTDDSGGPPFLHAAFTIGAQPAVSLTLIGSSEDPHVKESHLTWPVVSADSSPFWSWLGCWR